MKSFLEVLLCRSVIKLPSYRLYWKTSLVIEPITSAISCDHFHQIKQYLHFNNSNSQKANDHPQHAWLAAILSYAKQKSQTTYVTL